MKTMKHFVSLFLIVVMLFSLAITVNAATTIPNNENAWDPVYVDFSFSFANDFTYNSAARAYGLCVGQITQTKVDDWEITSYPTLMKYYRIGNELIIEGNIPILYNSKKVFLTKLDFRCKLKEGITGNSMIAHRTWFLVKDAISGDTLTVDTKSDSGQGFHDKFDPWYLKLQGTAVKNAPFTDINIKKDRWTHWYVSTAYYKGLTTGTTATTYSPNKTIKRAEFVQMLYKAAGSPKVSGKMPFTDVKKGKYYYDAVLWAYKKGITTGTTSTTFSPNSTCTKAQIVSFVYAYLGKPGNNNVITFTKKSEFGTGMSVSGKWMNIISDVPAGKYYYKPVDWLINNTKWFNTSYSYEMPAAANVPLRIAFKQSSPCTRAFAMFMIVSAIQGK